MTPELVVFGNLLVDDVVLADGSTRMAEPGGAALYCCLGARLWDLATGAVSVRGADYPAWAYDGMAARGVALDGVRPLGRPGLRIWLLYEDARRQIVKRLDRPDHLEMCPAFDDVPAAWRHAKAFHVSPMAFESQCALVDRLAQLDGVFVSLDPFALLNEGTLPAWRGVLSKLDALFVSEDEMELRFDDALAAGRALAKGRLRYVVLKRGARGGALYDAREDRVVEWSARAERVVDPTGAGDVFATSLLAGLLRGDDHVRALQRAVAGTSFVLEGYGPRGILAASPDGARSRLSSWFGA